MSKGKHGTILYLGPENTGRIWMRPNSKRQEREKCLFCLLFCVFANSISIVTVHNKSHTPLQNNSFTEQAAGTLVRKKVKEGFNNVSSSVCVKKWRNSVPYMVSNISIKPSRGAGDCVQAVPCSNPRQGIHTPPPPLGITRDNS